LLPLGGLLGFKGFGMAVMLDVFCGILSGSGVCRTDLPAGANGVWIYLLDIRQFLPEEQYQALIERYVATLKATPKLPGVDEILLPGEIENRRRQERLRDGIPIPEKTWELLQELAAKLGVAL
jgi:uncharacterized oxidoreductase